MSRFMFSLALVACGLLAPAAQSASRPGRPVGGHGVGAGTVHTGSHTVSHTHAGTTPVGPVWPPPMTTHVVQGPPVKFDPPHLGGTPIPLSGRRMGGHVDLGKVPQSTRHVGGLRPKVDALNFVLPQSVNTQLAGLAGGNKVTDPVKNAINHALSGGPLSGGDRALLQSQLSNGNLTATEKAAIARALQEDLKEKLSVALSTSTAGGVGSVVVPIGVPTPIITDLAGGTGSILAVSSGSGGVAPGELPPVVAGGSDIDDSAPSTEWGLKIVRVGSGTAADRAGLKVGDVILAVGQSRVRSFELLSAALAQAGPSADVVFLNAENGQVEKVSVAPAGGKLGVAAEPVEVR